MQNQLVSSGGEVAPPPPGSRRRALLGRPLAIYIHWPFCRAKCPYCDFNSHVREGVDQAAWKNALLQELAYAASLTPGRRVESIFFGGGTPSLMPPEMVAALIDAVHQHWECGVEQQGAISPQSGAPCEGPLPRSGGNQNNLEITLEANPTSVEAASFKGFRQAGVNRVSLGVQALNAADLKFLGRNHNAEEALAAVALAADIFPRYSFDLIYARPNQTAAAWEQELQEALKHARGHLSLYQLTIEENTAFHPMYARGDFSIPEDGLAAELYTLTQTIMEDAGMPAYEISNHAAPGQESRHNLAYWRGHEYVGVGPGAHGRINGLEDARHSTLAIKSPERWLEAARRQGHGYEAITALTTQEVQQEALMMRLRLVEGFPRDELPFIQPRAIETMQKAGLLEPGEEYIKPTLRGKLLLNYLAAQLLPE